MLTTIAKSWTFESAHRLPHVRDGHKCKRMHGHTYKLELELSGDVAIDGDVTGMIWDYDALDVAITPLVDLVDHRVLNEIDGLANPTTEVLVQWFASRLLNMGGEIPRLLTRVRVYESTTTYAEVYTYKTWRAGGCGELRP